MKCTFFTNEYPPHIYGGAGVHVAHLSRELAKHMEVDVRCFGEQEEVDGHLTARGYPSNKSHYHCPKPLHPVFDALQRCLDFNTSGLDSDIVHCHTWYSHFAGILAKLNYGIPLVVTVHSLEPLRPWKREQLAGGYDFTCALEKTALDMADAVIAVSKDTQEDIQRLFPEVSEERIHIIHNGIDPEEYHPTSQNDALRAYGIDPHRPYLLFVGRITRQKGILHLVRAIRYFNPEFQVVLCAGSPDTEEIREEMQQEIDQIKAQRDGIFWIQDMLPPHEKIQFYSHASLFVCPSIYEPFGIINLEAMACETPVIASAVGGITEVVVHEETGLLVPLCKNKEGNLDGELFEKTLAEKVNALIADPEKRARFAHAGRVRAKEKFSWASIAKKTETLYRSVIEKHPQK